MNETIALVALLMIIGLEILAILRTTGSLFNSSESGRRSEPRPAPTPAASRAVAEAQARRAHAARYRSSDSQAVGFHPGPIRRPYGPAGLLTPDIRWGPAIQRPNRIPILNGQKICIICQKPIDMSYQNTGWVRCERNQKLVHGHCFQEWLRAGRCGCPTCNGASDHGVSPVLF